MKDFGDIALASLQELRKTSQLADFTLVSPSGKEWKVHKVVLFIYSDVLHRMSTSENLITGRIVLKDIQEQSVEALVEFFYTYKLDSHLLFDDDSINIDERPSFFIDIWHLADMDDIKGLKKQVLDEFGDYLVGDLEIDYMHCTTVNACAFDLPHELWQEMVKVLADNLTQKHVWKAEDVKDLLEIHPNLAVDVMTRVSMKSFCKPKPRVQRR